MTRYSAQTDLYRDQFIGILSHDLRSPLGAITAGARCWRVPPIMTLARQGSRLAS
jgi:hypothetical protein